MDESNFPPVKRRHSDACKHCGGTSLKELTVSDTVDFRGLTLDIEGMHLSKCISCNHSFENAEQKSFNEGLKKDAYVRERDLLRTRDGLLSSDEISHIRHKFSLTQREAAIIFGGGPNAFNKYESGEVLQSVSMDRLLRLADKAGGSAIAYLEILTQTVRENFALSHRPTIATDIAKPDFIQVVLGMYDQSPMTLEIIHERTQSKILDTVQNTVFQDTQKMSMASQTPYLTITSGSSLNTNYFTELK